MYGNCFCKCCCCRWLRVKPSGCAAVKASCERMSSLMSELGPDNNHILMEVIAGFGLGGSTIALFARVGGGIFTKAADVGSDLAGIQEFTQMVAEADEEVEEEKELDEDEKRQQEEEE